MVKEKESDQSYIKCIENIIRDNDGLWFNDELLVIEIKLMLKKILNLVGGQVALAYIIAFLILVIAMIYVGFF